MGLFLLSANNFIPLPFKGQVVAKKKTEKKATKKTAKRVVTKRDLEWVECPDCGREYSKDAPHEMFCEARTCSECHVTYGQALPVSGKNDDGEEERICQSCLAEHDEEDEEEEQDEVEDQLE